MQIKRFFGSQVHGYLNYDLSLNSDLTFLHGINGTGKTTAIRAIVALLNFDVMWLVRTKFSVLTVIASHKGSDLFIHAERDKRNLTVTAGTVTRPREYEISIPIPPQELLDDESRFETSEDYIYRFARNNDADNYIRVNGFFSRLPKPLFLGLDRTTVDLPAADARRAARERPAEINSRTHLDISLLRAEGTAREAFLAYQQSRQAAATEIRNRLPLILFQPVKDVGQLGLRYQTKSELNKDLREYRHLRSQLIKSYASLDYNGDEIRQVISDYFERIIAIKNKLIEMAPKPGGRFDDAHLELLFELNQLESPLPFIKEISTLLSGFQKKQEQQYAPFSDYLAVMNGFLDESKKALSFQPNGRLGLKLPNGEMGNVRQLSSGERQIFVLITQLAFKSSEGGRDVLIIDEPELSLHIAWQMQFVEAIQRVSPKTQIILATHSPSIILDKDEKCVDVSQAA